MRFVPGAGPACPVTMKSGGRVRPLVSSHDGNGSANGTSPGETAGRGAPEWLQAPLDWVQAPENVVWVRLIVTVLVLVAAWAIARLAGKALQRSARRIAHHRRMDEQQTRAMVGRTRPMQLAVGIGLAVVAVISIVGVWGLQTAFTGLLAGAGFAGIVIGLAAADTIGDVVAGFMIFYNHPFDIGDWVEIDGLEGIVDDVALGATTLITWDNEKVTIPNRLVDSTKVKNFSHARSLRRSVIVSVDYGTDLQRAMGLLIDLAKAHPEVFHDPEPSAVAVGFADSSVDLKLRFYVEPVRSSAIAVYTDLVHQVHDAFHEQGISIAYPHMQIVQGRAWRMASGVDG